MELEILERKQKAISEALVDINLTLSCLNDSLDDYNKIIAEQEELDKKLKETIDDMRCDTRDLRLLAEDINDVLISIDNL